MQVMQGKLSTANNTPIYWLAFKTSNPDVRTCGFYVQPSNAKAVLTTYTANAAKALDSITLSCNTSANPARLLALSNATFQVNLPAVQPLNPMAPAACIPVFTQPVPNISTADGDACRSWVTANNAKITQPSNPLCPCELLQRLGACWEGRLYFPWI
jgi:hypothetical protein